MWEIYVLEIDRLDFYANLGQCMENLNEQILQVFFDYVYPTNLHILNI